MSDNTPRLPEVTHINMDYKANYEACMVQIKNMNMERKRLKLVIKDAEQQHEWTKQTLNNTEHRLFELRQEINEKDAMAKFWFGSFFAAGIGLGMILALLAV